MLISYSIRIGKMGFLLWILSTLLFRPVHQLVNANI